MSRRFITFVISTAVLLSVGCAPQSDGGGKRDPKGTSENQQSFSQNFVGTWSADLKDWDAEEMVDASYAIYQISEDKKFSLEVYATEGTGMVSGVHKFEMGTLSSSTNTHATLIFSAAFIEKVKKVNPKETKMPTEGTLEIKNGKLNLKYSKDSKISVDLERVTDGEQKTIRERSEKVRAFFQARGEALRKKLDGKKYVLVQLRDVTQMKNEMPQVYVTPADKFPEETSGGDFENVEPKSLQFYAGGKKVKVNNKYEADVGFMASKDFSAIGLSVFVANSDEYTTRTLGGRVEIEGDEMTVERYSSTSEDVVSTGYYDFKLVK